MPPNFKVAFIGDQGLGRDSRAVLEMIRGEGADMVLHSGDFDYYDDPDGWDQQINETLGEDFPYFASIGNNDVRVWEDYQRKLLERLARISGASCTGDLGVNSFCTYKGLFFVLSGVGTIDSGRSSHIREALASKEAEESIWRICSWHKNQSLMQVGGKGDGVGWEPYEECRKGGAIIATGHEHSYSRTHLMDNFETQSIASKSAVLHVDNGKSFAFVSGIAGHSIRGQDDQLAANPWWAAVHTSAQDANHGALFCSFNHGGVENLGYCYFKDLDEVIPDAFEVIVGPVPTPAPTPVPFAQYDTHYIRWLKSNKPALYRQIQEMPWVRDGVGRWESDSIYWLAQMAHDNETAASRIPNMPFLESHEPRDSVTVMALYRANSLGDLNFLVSQPVFQGGIENANSTLAILGSFIAIRPGNDEILERVLAPGYADVETLSRPTALSPHMKVSIYEPETNPSHG